MASGAKLSSVGEVHCDSSPPCYKALFGGGAADQPDKRWTCELAARKILVLNGPNLNVLGRREPAVYGTATLSDIEAACAAKAAELGLALDFRQSNHEGECVDWIQAARDTHAGIVINPAAFTHTSLAILDALLYSELPVVELHLSNPFRREPFRHHSYVSHAATGVICGFGAHGYLLALEAIARLVAPEPAPR